MDMSGMNSSPLSNAPVAACKISMLWNWYTIEACFITEQWHVRSVGGYIGTILGVFFLVVALEGFRRLGREYDSAIREAHYASETNAVVKGGSEDGQPEQRSRPFSPTFLQHLIRSVFYGVQFSTGYMLMLMAMYYNGGVLLAIFMGAFAGYLIFCRDTVGDSSAPGMRGECCA